MNMMDTSKGSLINRRRRLRRRSSITPIESCGEHGGDGDAAADDDVALSFVSQLCHDLPLYLAAVEGFTCNHADVGEFTEAVLGWWKNHSAEVGAWAIVAQIAFALTTNSALR